VIDRLRNVPARQWIVALERDGFRLRKGRGSHHVYEKADRRRVLVVYHKLSDTFGPKTIAQMLSSTGWSADDLMRLRLLS
jgi:predicted RNA binding protein YcfA (HicA-like mRNA interferase family)